APGAAMAFMVAGGVSCIPAAIAVFALVRLPVFFWYLGIALVGSLAAGIGFQMFIA
ncbi:MAG: permease, partial [Alphaproteobacteria bacterium]|nr:permease [Alphaproteobacteria bacterium]